MTAHIAFGLHTTCTYQPAHCGDGGAGSGDGLKTLFHVAGFICQKGSGKMENIHT